jgi:hypothetical protein
MTLWHCGKAVHGLRAAILFFIAPAQASARATIQVGREIRQRLELCIFCHVTASKPVAQTAYGPGNICSFANPPLKIARFNSE